MLSRSRPTRSCWPWVARGAAAAASVPEDLLGGYLTMLADAAINGRRPKRSELDDVRMLGRQAAEQGIDARQVVDLFLSAAWRLWSELPNEVRTRDRNAVSAAAEAVLRVVGDAVAVLVEGYQAERRHMIRLEEAMRREVIDDLLRGDSDVARMVERAEPFGLDLALPHAVLLAAPAKPLADSGTATALLERAVIDRVGDRDVLVATKDDQIVILVPGLALGDRERSGPEDIAALVHIALSRVRKGDPWRVAAGRPHPGAPMGSRVHTRKRVRRWSWLNGCD